MSFAIQPALEHKHVSATVQEYFKSMNGVLKMKMEIETNANVAHELPIAPDLLQPLQIDSWCLQSQQKVIEEVDLRKYERRRIKSNIVPVLYELIDRSTGRSVGYSGSFCEPPRALKGQLPDVEFADGVMYVGNRHLDLRRRPQIARLFAAFCASGNKPISRDELLAKVYENAGNGTNCSRRLLESRRAAIVKMVGKARRLVRKRFGEAFGHVEWLTYKPEHEGWRLMRQIVKT